MPARVFVTGESLPGPCGVRDYAATLAAGLSARGVPALLSWTERSPARTPAAALRLDRAFVASLASVRRGDVVVLNYSPFVPSWRGVPLLAPLLPLRLRRRGVRVVLVLHELAYPWGRRGLRDRIWAATQHAVLPLLVRPAHHVVVTTSHRADWLAARLRVPRSRISVVPVWSSLPRFSAVPVERSVPTVGFFGWTLATPADRALVVSALRLLVSRHPELRFALVGGRATGPALDAWRASFAAAGLASRLEVTGPLSAPAVAAHLTSLSAYLHADLAGPAARKSSLATALGLGLPIVAPDGPETWPELRAAGAVALVSPAPAPVAAAVGELLSSPPARAALAARAAAFYDAHAALDLALDRYASLLG